jgi:hypothetical protein
VQTVTQGNAHLIAPLSQSVAPDTPPEHWIALTGANLLTDTPELIAWLSTLESALDIAALAYLDGERHVRMSMAVITLPAQASSFSGHAPPIGARFVLKARSKPQNVERGVQVAICHMAAVGAAMHAIRQRFRDIRQHSTPATRLRRVVSWK